MKFYFQLFRSFLKIGAFTIGGGYAMIPLIENEVVNRRKWLDSEEFSEALTLAQSSPGPIAINAAVFVGYKLRGLKGVTATTLATVLPSFVIILLIAMFFAGAKENAVVERIFKGLRPAVVALIAIPVVNMLKNKHFAWQYVVIAALAMVAVAIFHFSPVMVIVAAGVIGIIRLKIKS